MAVVRTYEQFTHTPSFALGGIDSLAFTRSTKGQIPPVLGEVKFFITRRVSPPLQTFDPPLELIHWTNRSGFFLFSGATRSPELSGHRSLAPGNYRCRVESDYYQTIDPFVLTWPPAQVYDPTKDLILLPGPNYPFPDFSVLIDKNGRRIQRKLGTTVLRGSLFGAGGAPQENVEITFIPPIAAAFTNRFQVFPKCRTDKNGNWVVSMIDKQPVPVPVPDPFDQFLADVDVNLFGGPYSVSNLTITLGAENSLRQTGLRGRVVHSNGRPFPNVKITTSVGPGVSVSRSDGQWFFYFKLGQANGPVTVTATAPDGQNTNSLSQIQRDSITVVPTFELS
jgi:hypothetical protein